MQSLPTLTVCTLYAGIIRIVLFHNSVRIDRLPQLTRARVVSIVTDTYHNFNITVFLAYLSWLLLVASTVGVTVESNRTNRFESFFCRESNQIESKLFLANPNALLQENVWNTAKKRKKSRFLDFEKNVKNVKNVEVITYRSYRPEDHGDHPQSVLLSFTQLCGAYFNQRWTILT